jgi:photosystem II stability/assembly factor-like uncharacterized protein
MSRRLCLAIVVTIALLACLAPAAAAVPAWTVRTDIVPPGDFAYSVDFTDAQHGWIGLASGGILMTDDGGDTWTPQATGVTSPIYQIVMVDDLNGWARTDAATALRTTDGGKNWAAMKVFPGGTRTTDDLAAISASTAWVLHDGRVCCTIDGGATWTSRTGFNNGRVFFTSASEGWAVDLGRIYKTTDGGQTWTPTYTSDSFSDIVMFDSLHGIATGAGVRYTTEDGGATWTRQYMSTSAGVSDWSDLQHGWVSRTIWDGSQRIEGTDDGGQTWFGQTPYDYALRVDDIDTVGDIGWAAAGAKVLTTQKNGYTDMRPPTTTLVGEKVANHEITVSLQATDDVSPADAIVTMYRIDDAESDPYLTWNPAIPVMFKVPSDPKTETYHNVYVYSVDAYGNEEAWHADSYCVDTLAPVTRLTPKVKWQLDWWNNTASYVTVTGIDKGPAGVARIEICRDKSTWTEVEQGFGVVTPAPKDHSNDGVFPLWVRTTDCAGNIEVVKKHEVYVDTRRPTAGAPSSAATVHGGTAHLKFRINDRPPCCTTGRVFIAITNTAGTKRYKTITPKKWYAKNKTLMVSFACTLAPRTYRFWVWVSDGAGNASAKAARNTLVVR